MGVYDASNPENASFQQFFHLFEKKLRVLAFNGDEVSCESPQHAIKFKK